MYNLSIVNQTMADTIAHTNNEAGGLLFTILLFVVYCVMVISLVNRIGFALGLGVPGILVAVLGVFLFIPGLIMFEGLIFFIILGVIGLFLAIFAG